MQNVEKSKSGCIGCGACVVECPKKIITLHENKKQGCFVKVRQEECIGCRKCINTCAAIGMKKPENLDRISSVYLGSSDDQNIYYNSASGGAVTTILTKLFEENKIDAALVAHFDNKANVFGDFITCSEDAVTYAGSFYHTSAQMINIDKIKKYQSIVFVGLPCHINAFKKYAKRNNLKNIYLTISLICSIGRLKTGFDWYLTENYKFDFAKETILSYKSRVGDSRKGFVVIESEKKKIKFKDEAYRAATDFIFTNRTCLNCRKLFGVAADLSAGDAWHIQTNSKVSLVLTNSRKGVMVAQKLGECWRIQEGNPQQIALDSQTFGTGLKIVHNKNYIRGMQLLHFINANTDSKFIYKISLKVRSYLLRRIRESGKKYTEGMGDRR